MRRKQIATISLVIALLSTVFIENGNCQFYEKLEFPAIILETPGASIQVAWKYGSIKNNASVQGLPGTWEDFGDSYRRGINLKGNSSDYKITITAMWADPVNQTLTITMTSGGRTVLTQIFRVKAHTLTVTFSNIHTEPRPRPPTKEELANEVVSRSSAAMNQISKSNMEIVESVNRLIWALAIATVGIIGVTFGFSVIVAQSTGTDVFGYLWRRIRGVGR